MGGWARAPPAILSRCRQGETLLRIVLHRTWICCGNAVAGLALAGALAAAAAAQQTLSVLATVSTVAGTSVAGWAGNGGPATAAQFNGIIGVAQDADGNLYLADSANNQVRMVTPAGVVQPFAGTGSAGFGGDGAAATGAQLNAPTALAADGKGNLYVADAGNYRIRRISSAGVISTVAGTGTPGFSGDNGAATSAQIGWVASIALDGAGNLYLADTLNQRVRRVTPGGAIATVAGTGTAGYRSADTVAASAELNMPSGVALDAAGNLYIADRGNNLLRVVSPAGAIASFAGSGAAGYSGDGGAALAAALDAPAGVALDGSGNLYFSDSNNGVVRRVKRLDGTISTVAGNGSFSYSGDGGPGPSAGFGIPWALAVNVAGNILVGDYTANVVRKLSFVPEFGGAAVGGSAALPLFLRANAATMLGSVNVLTSGASGQDFQLLQPDSCSIALQLAAGQSCQLIVQFTPLAAGVRMGSATFTDGGTPPNVLATVYLSGVGVAPQIAFAPGIMNTVAGNGTQGSDAGDGGPATSAVLGAPEALAMDFAGDLFIAELHGHAVRKVSGAGVISTYAGNGNQGYSGDGGAATAAMLDTPSGLALDGAGNLYIADRGSSVIRKVSAAGVITTVAGNGAAAYGGDGGAATAAQLNAPSQIAVDARGDLYIADTANSVVRRVDSAGVITTVAGTHSFGYSGDGVAATQAEFGVPAAVAVDAAGNLYIPDPAYSVVRMVNPLGIVSTIAGTGTSGYSGDGGPASKASLGAVSAIALDAAGDIFLADATHSVVRRISAADGTISTATGTGLAGFTPELLPATASGLSDPQGLAVDPEGNLYIADLVEERVFEVALASPPALRFPETVAGSSSLPLPLRVENSGSAPLTLSQIAVNGSFMLTLARGGCEVSDQVLEPGAGCLLEALFAPQSAGPATASVTVTDNSRNVAAATQSIPLAGSAVANGTQAAAPVFLLPAGSYPPTQYLYIADSTPGATIYFTLDGSAPGVNSPVYMNALALVQPTTVRAIAYASGYSASEISSASYTIEAQTAAPTFSQSSGGYSGSLTVSITDTESAAAIYYTLDGSTPTASSALYTAPLTLTRSAVLSATAVGTGEVASTVTVANYSIVTAAGSYAFPAVAVGGVSSAANIPISFTSAATVGRVVVLTLGAAGGDFSSTVGSTCQAGSYGAGQSCLMSIVFAPRAAGLRRGAVVLYDAATPPNALQTIYLSGVGEGPVAAVNPGGIRTVAGTGVLGFLGDGAAATGAELSQPSYTALDGAGNLYISDPGNFRVRKVTSAGVISTVAGNGLAGAGGDGGPATGAELMSPHGLVVDGAGNLYIADPGAYVVRMVTPAGIISTVAGNGAFGYDPGQDGGPAVQAMLWGPYGLAMDGAGNLYIADFFAYVVRMVAPSGIITTVAGNATPGYSGDGGAATGAEIVVSGVAVDAAGNLYLADYFDSVIRKVSGGKISTVAGTGAAGFTGDGGPALSAQLSNPWEVQVDAAGNLYLCDESNNRIRMISAATGTISTIAGSGATGDAGGGFGGDAGPATSARLNAPNSLSLDASGRLYVADMLNNRVRVVDPTAPAAMSFGAVNAGAASPSQSAQLINLGNQPLAVVSVTVPAGFRLLSPGSSGNCATGSQQLSPGAGCRFAVAFAPQAAGTAAGVVAARDNSLNAAGSRQSITLQGSGQPANSPAATPLFSPAGGSFSAPVMVALSSATVAGSSSGGAIPATIYYTLDGSSPGTGSAVYTKPLTISASQTLSAVAAAPGYALSGVTSADFSILTPPPTFSLAAGSYPTAQTVTITGAASGASIYYTLDGSSPSTATVHGSVPSASAQLYGTALAINSSATLQAVALAPGLSLSASTSAAYVIQPVGPTPGLSLAAGSYPLGTSISITDALPQAAIYYTTDGVTPPAAGLLYSAPITLTTAMTLQAVAVSPGYGVSAVVSAGYTLTGYENLPQLTALSPAVGTAGSGLTLSVGGSNFNSSSVVLWNGQPLATSLASGGVLTAVVPASLASAGTAYINVVNSFPSPAIGIALPLAVQAATVVPAISAASVTGSTGNFQLTLLGSGFLPGSQVYWNGAMLNSIYLGPNELSAMLPNPQYAQYPVTVAGPGGSSLPFQLP